MIQRPRSLLRGTEPTPGLLKGVIDEFRRGHERLSRLKQYYLAENDILSRAARHALPNVRLPHAFARYIVMTPVSSSPLRTAHWIGAAPRYFGSSDP